MIISTASRPDENGRAPRRFDRWPIHYAVSLLWIVGVTAGAAATDGVYVLEGVAQGVAGRLEVTPQGSPLDLKLDVSFRRMTETNALKRYEAPSDRQMIWNIVSDDLGMLIERDVAHVIDGHGQSRIRFATPGLYHLFAEGQPKTLPDQVMRFDLTVGDPADAAPDAQTQSAAAARDLVGPVADAEIGPYQLRFDTLDLQAGADAHLVLRVTESARPAGDIRPAGDPATGALMIASSDLHVVSIKPDPSATTVPGLLAFIAHPLEPGTYRLFITIAGKRMRLTAPFVAVVHG